MEDADVRHARFLRAWRFDIPCRISGMRRRAIPDAAGFTLIEVLVALAVLSIIAAAVFHSAIAVATAAEETRLSDESRMAASRLAAGTLMGRSPSDMAADDWSGWNVTMRTVTEGAETNRVVWNRWVISPKARPSLQTVLCLRSRK